MLMIGPFNLLYQPHSKFVTHTHPPNKYKFHPKTYEVSVYLSMYAGTLIKSLIALLAIVF